MEYFYTVVSVYDDEDLLKQIKKQHDHFVAVSIITAIVSSPQRFLNKHKFWAYPMLVRHIEESDGKVYGRKKIRGRAELKLICL